MHPVNRGPPSPLEFATDPPLPPRHWSFMLTLSRLVYGRLIAAEYAALSFNVIIIHGLDTRDKNTWSREKKLENRLT